jgi:ELWxxDGT repeat protein
MVFDPTTSTVNVVGQMAALGNRLIFACNGLSGTGTELWTSDGTTSGTVMVKDINPALGISSSPHSFAQWNGHLYFFATPTTNGQTRLCRTDGTETGTVVLSTAVAGNQQLPANEQTVATSDGVYFIASAGGVFRWDGSTTDPFPSGLPTTANATVRVLAVLDNLVYSVGNQRLYRREGSGSITTLTTGSAFVVGDLLPVEAGPTWTARLYFNGGTSGTNSEPWVTDGTPGGTIALKDVYPGTPSSFPRWMGSIEGKAIVSANDASFPDGTGTEPWVSDGTPSGTMLLKDIAFPAPSSAPTDFFSFAGSLFFDALTDTLGNERHRLTPPNTVTLCEETMSGTQSWSRDEPTVVGENVFSRVNAGGVTSIRVAPTGEGIGTELVSINGTTTYNGRLYTDGALCYFQFRAAGATTDDYSVPWRSDGSPTGTFPLATATVGQPSNVYGWTQYQNETYFLAKNFSGSTDTGYALYATSGEVGNTRIVPGVGGSGTINTTTLRLLTANGKLFYNAFSAGAQTQLWVYDGAASTFARVRPSPTSVGSQLYCSTPAVLNERVIWGADIDQSQDGELWSTDGTQSGTLRIKDILPGHKGSYPTGMTAGPSAFGPRIYFSANDGATGRELWMTDGTSNGTILVKDIHPGIAGSFPQSFVVVGDRVYFLASDGVHGLEWWVTDGTHSGTHMVADIYPGPAASTYLLSGNSNLPKVFDNKLYIAADSPGIGRELWVIDPLGDSCTADFNADTVVDLFDYLDFVASFAANDPIADFNADTVVDFFDYLDFVAAFAAGC